MLLRLILKQIMQLNQIKDKGHYKVLKNGRVTTLHQSINGHGTASWRTDSRLS